MQMFSKKSGNEGRQLGAAPFSWLQFQLCVCASAPALGLVLVLSMDDFHTKDGVWYHPYRRQKKLNKIRNPFERYSSMSTCKPNGPSLASSTGGAIDEAAAGRPVALGPTTPRPSPPLPPPPFFEPQFPHLTLHLIESKCEGRWDRIFPYQALVENSQLY